VAVLRLSVLAGGMLALGLVIPVWLLVSVARDDEGTTHGQGRSRVYTAVDSSGHGNDGVIQGSPVMGLPGHEGTAYSFLSGKSRVQVPSTPELTPGRRDFMVSAWVRFEDVLGVDETSDIIRKGESDTTEGDFKLEIIDPGGVRCSVKDSARRQGRVSTDVVDVSDGRWHHIGCARPGSVLSVVADGVVTSKPVRLGFVGNTLPLAIGSKYGWEDQSEGRVDEVRMVVSEDPSLDSLGPEQAVRALEATAPVGLWHLDEAEFVG